MTESIKQKREKLKICEFCQESIHIAFRIKISKTNPWVFVCKTCCQKSTSLIGYQYGGTWKSKKK